MSTLILALLLAQSTPDPALNRKLAGWMQEAQEHWSNGRLEEACAGYTRVLNRAPDGTWQASVLPHRSQVLLELGRPLEALADAEQYADLRPDEPLGCELQADALYELGRLQEAHAMWNRAQNLRGLGDVRLGETVWDPVPFASLSLITPATLAWAGFVLLAVNVRVGSRQRREGRGTWRRLVWVAAVVAGMQLLPYVIWWLVRSLGLVEVTAETGMPQALFVGLPAALILFAMLGPPARFLHSTEALPLVEDEAFLARVAELATGMGLPVPVVRLLPTGGGELQAQALAGGLVAPSLVVADGILHRLSPQERDAVLGHELAHLANRSLWWLFGVIPIAATAGVLMTNWFGPGLSLAVFFTLFVGLRHIVSRHFEYDCDRRAAEVLGYRTAFSALQKIHAASQLKNSGWLSHVVFATATHPSRPERLASLRKSAPTDDCPQITWSEEELSHRRLGGRIAFALWVTSLIVIPLWAWQRPDSGWPALTLGIVGLVPWFAILIAIRSASRDTRRRMVERGRYRRQVPLIASCLILVWFFATDPLAVSIHELEDSEDQWIRVAQILAVMGAVIFLLISGLGRLAGGGRQRKVLQQAAIAMQTRNFDAVFDLAKQHPRAFKRSIPLRHNLGFALAMADRRDQAVKVLEGIRLEEPGYAESTLVLAMLHEDEGRPEAALPLIESVQKRLPNDPTPPLLRAIVLRHLGRLDEAQASIDAGLTLKPDSGNGHAAAAWVALDRGERQRAEELLSRAEELDPATAFIESVKARVALAGDDPEAARQQVIRAIAASDANPFALLQNQAKMLSQELEIHDQRC